MKHAEVPSIRGWPWNVGENVGKNGTWFSSGEHWVHLKNWPLGFMFWAISTAIPFSDYFTGVSICSFCCFREYSHWNSMTWCWQQWNQGKEASFQLCPQACHWSSLCWWRKKRCREQPSARSASRVPLPRGWNFSFCTGSEESDKPSCELLSFASLWRAVPIQAQKNEANVAQLSFCGLRDEWWENMFPYVLSYLGNE